LERNVLNIFAGLIALWIAAEPAQAQLRQVTGTAGYLSEWELRGALTEQMSAGKRAFSGPVTWKHVGLCSVSGPQEKPGEMSYEMAGSGAASRIKATITFEGAQCTFSGNFSDNMTGHLDCPDAKGVPLSLSVK
jgi:hypothetical protein